MQLFIDVGNQRLKWISKSNNNLRSHGMIDYHVNSFNKELNHQFSKSFGLNSVWIASVLQKKTDQLIEYFQDTWDISPYCLQSMSHTAGVTNHYLIPNQLGVDRWSAIIAAWTLFGKRSGVIIIDVGTAVTIDYVDLNGDFKGGIIFPGIQTMQHALNTHTEQITIPYNNLIINSKKTINMLNLDTESAVRNGIHSAVMSTIENAVMQFKEIVEKNVKVVITGGGAETISLMTNLEMQREDDLVLNGVEIIAKYLSTISI